MVNRRNAKLVSFPPLRFVSFRIELMPIIESLDGWIRADYSMTSFTLMRDALM